MNDIHSDDVDVIGVAMECTLLLFIEEAGGVKAVVVVLLLLVEIDMQTSAVANFDRPLDIVGFNIDRCDSSILQLIYELEVERRRQTKNWSCNRCLSSMWLHFHFEWPRKETLLRPLSTVT